MKLPTYRLSWLFILALIVGVAANWWSHQLKIESAVEKVGVARANFWPFFDSYSMADAVNELRGLSHADAMRVLDESYSGDFDFGFFDTLVPLVFEPTPTCPQDKLYVFEFGETQNGAFEIKNDLPVLIGWYQHEGMPFFLPTTPLLHAQKWGQVRSGFLNPPPQQSPFNKHLRSRDDIKWIRVP